MAEEKNQKIKLMKIMEILRQETDEEHPMTKVELAARLVAMNVSCSPRSLIRDIKLLNEQGYEIMERLMGHEKGYFVCDRSFSVPELKILIDAVQAAGFVTEKKTGELVDKIAALGGSHRAAILKGNIVKFNTRKHTNETIYYTVGFIEDAIQRKWYKYVSQVVRMFDKELHREFVYCSFLVGLLPAEVVVMDNIAKLLTLEMYKLEKTFDGDISLGDESGIYTAAEPKGAGKPEDKDPLDEIIARINEKYKGEFTDADRVMIGALADKLRGDPRLANMAMSSDPQIFAESIFPQAFNIAAQDSYIESQETYTSLFEDQSKYNAIPAPVAPIMEAAAHDY